MYICTSIYIPLLWSYRVSLWHCDPNEISIQVIYIFCTSLDITAQCKINCVFLEYGNYCTNVWGGVAQCWLQYLQLKNDGRNWN